MAFFGITVNVIIQKLKSKHIVCLSFLWWEVFLRERGKTFCTYSWPQAIGQINHKSSHRTGDFHKNVFGNAESQWDQR